MSEPEGAGLIRGAPGAGPSADADTDGMLGRGRGSGAGALTALGDAAGADAGRLVGPAGGLLGSRGTMWSGVSEEPPG